MCKDKDQAYVREDGRRRKMVAQALFGLDVPVGRC